MLKPRLSRIPDRPGFFMPLLSFILFAILWVSFFPKGTLVMLFNRHYQEPFNTLFLYSTYLGDGIMVLPFALLAALASYKRAFAVLIAGFGAGLVTQLLKRVVFPNHPRPSAYFPEGTLNALEGVTLHAHNSFPSGHSTTIFALATIFVLWLPKPWSFIIFVIAMFTGLSRVYLGQHFIEDVAAGAVIGSLFATLVFSITNKWIGINNPAV